ncbi:MAG: hypothetical protein KC609_01800, partial [Myxococcales bacterium]|nr:hypothetical protein [Myxococcales bacterium]
MKRSDLVGRCLDVLLIVALVATVSQAAAQPQPPTGVDVKPPSRDVTPSDARRAVLPPKVRLAPSDATAPRAPKPGTDGHQPTTAAPKPGTDGHQPTTTGDATTPTKKTPQKPQPPSEGDDGSTTAPSKKKAPTSGSTTPTTGKKGPPKAPNQLFEALRAEWQKTIDGWKRLRQQRLAIVSSYTKPSAEEDLKKRLSARYRQLLSKRRSNRQWHVYWKDEKQFAGTLVSLLEKTRDVAPKYVAMLIKAVGAERKAYQQTIKPSLPELETADNESLKTRFTELKTAWVGDQEAVKTLTKELATLRSELAEQEKKLAAAQTPEEKKTSSDAIAVAKTAIAAKEKELDQKQKAALRGKQRTSEAEQLLAAHLRQPPDDPALRKLTQRLLQQQKEVTKRQRLLAAAVESVARAADDFLLLKEELETITAERFVALDKQLGELKKRFETRGKEVFAASKDAEKTVAELDQLIRANERNKKLMARKLGTLVAKRDPLRQEIVKLKARLTSLKADKKNKQARKDARKFEAALRKATRELRTLDVEIGAMKKAQAKLESALWLRTLWRNALQHRAKPTGAQAFDDALRRFDAAHRDANARTQQRITSGALLLEYYGSLLRVVRVTR